MKTLVIWDRSWLDSSLIEETYDWYAQDKAGNVWYFGEDTKQYKDGSLTGTKGSWEAGVNGAEAGIIMGAKPQVGDSYRQEYSKGIAEDTAQVLSVNETVATPYGSFKGCLQTLDASTLDLQLKEHKYYCSEAGGSVTLIVDTNNNEREELVNIHTDASFSSPRTGYGAYHWNADYREGSCANMGSRAFASQPCGTGERVVGSPPER
ncbi:MAG: hypothetical protein ABIQ44_06790 [Chloroflexia bacterium]